MNTNPEKDPPIDKFYRNEERRWERERVAPVGEPPTEEDLRLSLAKTLPGRFAAICKKLEQASNWIDENPTAPYTADCMIKQALHDIRNIENGVLALCECVNGKPESERKV